MISQKQMNRDFNKARHDAIKHLRLARWALDAAVPQDDAEKAMLITAYNALHTSLGVLERGRNRRT